MLNKEQKIFNINQCLQMDGFSESEIKFIKVKNLDEDMLDALLDSECDEYNMFVNDVINELNEAYAQHQESTRV